jgi:hypothetical protein
MYEMIQYALNIFVLWSNIDCPWCLSINTKYLFLLAEEYCLLGLDEGSVVYILHYMSEKKSFLCLGRGDRIQL